MYMFKIHGLLRITENLTLNIALMSSITLYLMLYYSPNLHLVLIGAL